MDAVCGKSFDQSLWHSLRKAKAQDMWRPQRALGDIDAETAHAVGDSIGQHRKALCNGRRAPFGDHLHADRGHLQRNEMIALAHVEAPGVADVTEIGEIDVVLGAYVAAG